jgi:hypothetical protein
MVSKCDKHIFFTDSDAPGADAEDIVKVRVPRQDVTRRERDWLFHRNMVAHLPVWDYILQEGIAAKYDWTVNVELDHWFHAGRMRVLIARYLSILRDGTPKDRSDAKSELVFYLGNAFAFNRKTVNAMKLAWPKIGIPLGDHEGQGKGCPVFMKGMFEMPRRCSQDIAYPIMIGKGILRTPEGKLIPSYGRPGCGQPTGQGQSSHRGHLLPMGCWEMEKYPPYGRKKQKKFETEAIEALAKAQYVRSKDEAKEVFKGNPHNKDGELWELFWLGRDVPVVHHVHAPETLRLARELLKGPGDA